MTDGGLASRLRWVQGNAMFAFWAPLTAFLVFVLLHYWLIPGSNGIYFHGVVSYMAIIAARGYGRAQRPPPTPGWRFPGRSRPIFGEIGAVLVYVSVAVSVWLVGFRTPAVVIGVVATAAALAIVLWRLPRSRRLLELTPDGIVVRGRRVAWRDIIGVELQRGFGLELVIAVRAGRRAVLREYYVEANLVYLLDLIGYYFARPEQRGAIGTREESERVIAALTRARLAAPVGMQPVRVPS